MRDLMQIVTLPSVICKLPFIKLQFFVDPNLQFFCHSGLVVFIGSVILIMHIWHCAAYSKNSLHESSQEILVSET